MNSANNEFCWHSQLKHEIYTAQKENGELILFLKTGWKLVYSEGSSIFSCRKITLFVCKVYIGRVNGL